MKKLFKVIIVLLICLLIALSLSESFFYLKNYNNFKELFRIKNMIHGSDIYKLNYFSRPLYFDDVFRFKMSYKNMDTVNDKYKGKSCVVFGCSYPESAEINEEEKKFCYRLSDEIKRPVYNRSFGGGGFQHMYYLLTHQEYIQNIKNPEYIIYIFINDHIERFYKHQFWNPFETNENLRYKINNGKIERIHPCFFSFWFLFTVKEMQRNKEWTYVNEQPQDALFMNFVNFMKEVKKVSSEKYPDAKFIILLYDDGLTPYNKDYINDSDWNLLRKEGFYIYDTKDLTGKVLSDRRYKCDDLLHPNAQAWEEVVPPFVKEIKKL